MSFLTNDKEIILRLIEETERSKTLQFQQELSETDGTVTENITYYNELTVRMEKRGRVIQDYVREVIKQNVKLCCIMQEEQTNQLKEHKKELSKQFKQFKSDMKSCRLSVRTTSEIYLSELEQKLRHFNASIPKLPYQYRCVFTEPDDAFNTIVSAFGQLHSGRREDHPRQHVDSVRERHPQTKQNATKTSDEQNGNHSVTGSSYLLETLPEGTGDVGEDGAVISTPGKYTNNRGTTNRPFDAEIADAAACTLTDSCEVKNRNKCEQALQTNKTTTQTRSLPTDYMDVELEDVLACPFPSSWCEVSQFKHSSAITSICATSAGAWIAFDRLSSVVRVDRQGNVVQTVAVKDRVEAISVSTSSGRLWVATINGRIGEYLPNGSCGKVICIPPRPHCIWVAHYDIIVVGSLENSTTARGSISLYSTNGEKTNAIEGEQIKPVRVTSQNQPNGMIAVIHRGENGNRYVTVYNTQLETQFTTRSSRQLFDPSDVCFNTNGGVYVCVPSTKSIVVLDGCGHVLGTVSVQSTEAPQTISTYWDELWIGRSNRVVSVCRIEPTKGGKQVEQSYLL